MSNTEVAGVRKPEPGLKLESDPSSKVFISRSQESENPNRD